MKKLPLLTPLLMAVAALAACGGGPQISSHIDTTPGGATSRAAVERFFAAVHSQDLQAMGIVWGTSKGPARENMDRSELERREVILQCYFDFDSFRVIDESPTSEAQHVVRVQLVRGGRTRNPSVYTVLGPNNRWFVENLDIAAVRDFCGMAPATP